MSRGDAWVDVAVPGARPVTDLAALRQRRSGGKGTRNLARKDSKVRSACKSTGPKVDEKSGWRC